MCMSRIAIIKQYVSLLGYGKGLAWNWSIVSATFASGIKWDIVIKKYTVL